MFITLFFISFSFLQNCLFLLNQHTKQKIKKKTKYEKKFYEKQTNNTQHESK